MGDVLCDERATFILSEVACPIVQVNFLEGVSRIKVIENGHQLIGLFTVQWITCKVKLSQALQLLDELNELLDNRFALNPSCIVIQA